jgi:DnaJ-class molecular chaperone
LHTIFKVLSVSLVDLFPTNFFSFFGGGGGMEEEEERILKGDEVIVELEASLEDLYMGGSLKVTKIFVVVT